MKKFLMRFVYAFRGVTKAFKDVNLKWHGAAAIVVILTSWYYQLSMTEWIIILILIALVLATEVINSSIEDLNNTVTKANKLDYNATTDSRDMAAGAVLIITIVATVVGLIIFVPKIFS